MRVERWAATGKVVECGVGERRVGAGDVAGVLRRRCAGYEALCSSTLGGFWGIFDEFLAVFAQGTGDECRVPSGLTLKVRVNECCSLR